MIDLSETMTKPLAVRCPYWAGTCLPEHAEPEVRSFESAGFAIINSLVGTTGPCPTVVHQTGMLLANLNQLLAVLPLSEAHAS